MLKMPASGVLASLRPSTYHKGTPPALHSLRPCWTDILSILREIATQVPVTGKTKQDVISWVTEYRDETGTV